MEDILFPFERQHPAKLENPRVWASAALTTPTDDDMYMCLNPLHHAIKKESMGACAQCTDEKSEALDSTPLSYNLVFSTVTGTSSMYPPDVNSGEKIYKLVRCGSREAAIAEAFYGAGANGWSLVFACVMRLRETCVERPGGMWERVDELWELADESSEDDVVRVFY